MIIILININNLFLIFSIYFQDAFLAGQHFAKHYPASMKRIDKLRKESTENNKDNNTVNVTNFIDNDKDNNVPIEHESKNKNQLQYQIAKEKAAAKIFPLNLISNKFKAKDPNVLKGKLILYN